VAVTLLAILHTIPDADDPHAIVARLMDAVPAGSYLVLSLWGRASSTRRSSGRAQVLMRASRAVQ
jgi:hypothetical protein